MKSPARPRVVMLVTRLLELLVIPAAVTACAGHALPDSGAIDAGGGFDAGPYTMSPCPADAPDGGRCTGNFACEYGGDAWGNCTTIWLCRDGLWELFPLTIGCGPQAVTCPASFGATSSPPTCQESDNLQTDSPICTYGQQGSCGCVCGTYSCRAWDSYGPGCPVPRPRLGTLCPTEGVTCNYWNCCPSGPDDVNIGPPMVCSDGLWVFGGVCGDCAVVCAGP